MGTFLFSLLTLWELLFFVVVVVAVVVAAAEGFVSLQD